MDRTLSTADVARILGLEVGRVQAMVRAGLCRPARRGNRYQFSFQDLVVLRTAQGLAQSRVPTSRVKRALASLARKLPAGESLSGLRIYADGRQVVVKEGRTAWQPETGQTIFDFGVDDLSRRVARLQRSEAPSAAARPDAADRAQQEFERALELEGDDPRGAREAYRRAIELDPALADAYVNLGRLVFEGGDATEAVRLYRRAIELAPGDAIAHFNLALALEDAEGAPAALRSYQKAVELDPSFADAHFNLGALCEDLGRRSDALRHYAAYRRLTRRR